MLSTGRALFVSIALASTVFAGCVTPGPSVDAASLDGLPLSIDGVLQLSLENLMTFTQSIVSPAVGLQADLYEPTMEVSDTGTIYVAGHVIAAATTGTPAYFSNDDGATWAPLPFAGPVAAPSPLQGSQPPPGDEGVIIAGENGQAWMADIYLAGFSVTGWCDNGATQCFDNRQAYDRVAAATGCNPTLANVGPVPVQGSLNDRPWAAYGNGKLLVINNAGGGPLQLGVMDVPPAQPVGLVGVNGPTWNTCASEGGYIPGVPAMRPDGFFAVPQMTTMGDDNVLQIITGNADDIFTVETSVPFAASDAPLGDTNGGRTAFDATGALFVGAKNNTRANITTETDPTPILGGEFTTYDIGEGRFILAASTDDGKTYRNATFRSVSGRAVNSLYLDGAPTLKGVLAVWSELGDEDGRADWYVAHVNLGTDGAPTLSGITLVVDEGSASAAHIIGAGVGPDGRAYFLNFEDGGGPGYAGSTPISVWIQQEGPTLPTAVIVEAVAEAN